jgi:branched-chain amino acid transport system substrate-binding protein
MYRGKARDSVQRIPGLFLSTEGGISCSMPLSDSGGPFMKRSFFLILILLVVAVVAGEAPCADRPAALSPIPASGRVGTTKAIGVILPLTGRHSAYGNHVLDAMLLASTVLDRMNPAPVRIVIRDSESRSETLPALVEDLADREKVLMILGPLGEGTEAARLALERRVPMLVFTQQEGIGKDNAYILRDMLTNHAQIAALVDYAIARRGLRRFAVLSPEDAGGREMAKLFREEVIARGGRVVRERTYGRQQADFTDEIRSLAGLESSRREPEEPEGSVEVSPPAKVDFEALFLPDSLSRAHQAASQLAYLRIQDVQMLGPSSWNQPERVSADGGVLDGAVFADTFCLNDPSPIVQGFIERYYAATGREPGSLEAMAYDAATLVVRTVVDAKPGSGEQLRGMLVANATFRGVSGGLSFTADGESRREARILKITQGQIVPVR